MQKIVSITTVCHMGYRMQTAVTWKIKVCFIEASVTSSGSTFHWKKLKTFGLIAITHRQKYNLFLINQALSGYDFSKMEENQNYRM